jgi:hypothetical protein
MPAALKGVKKHVNYTSAARWQVLRWNGDFAVYLN